jgi:hypothetical protein
MAIVIGLFPRDARQGDRGAAAIAMAAGLALAGLGFAAFLPVPDLTAPLRTQFLPAPGLGVFLAGCALWLASWPPARLRPLAAAVLAGWVMWVGTACVHAMQRHWNMRSLYGRQSHFLRELTRLAPDLAPGTLVLLVDRTDAWRPFAFQHAVEYMYEGRATGHLAGPRENVLVPTHMTDAGVVREPIPAIRGPWRSPATVHRYEQVVVVRYVADGSVEVLDEWPRRLGELPAGASYAPRARIVPGGREPRSRAVLR